MPSTGRKMWRTLILCGALSGTLLLLGCSREQKPVQQSGPPSDVRQFVATLATIPESQRQPYLRAYPEMTRQAFSSTDPEVQAQLKKLVPGGFQTNP
jgi:hypothetical protein